jgi:hypothetical protein
VLDAANVENVGEHQKTWEKVLEKLRAGVMPPPGVPRPDPTTFERFKAWLETELDREAEVHPNPGRTVVRRMTAAEYRNAIRDLLAIDVDDRTLLFPADDADRHGFVNNGTVLSLSPALFDRYLTAARRISQLAIGDPTLGPGFIATSATTERMLYQDERMSDDLPFGSRGGIAVRQYFPLDAEYEVQVRLRRQIYDYIIGMRTPQELDVRLDGVLVKRFTVGGADEKGFPSAESFFGTIRGDIEWEDYVSNAADANLKVRFPAKAGLRVVGVTFAQAHTEPTGILERGLAGFALSSADFYNGNAAVERVDITGPINPVGSGDTPSRRQVFTCHPTGVDDEDRCAGRILTALTRRAYRRPVNREDIQPLLGFYRTGRAERTFEAGIQKAVERLLVAPEFLFRVEREPENVAPGTLYRISDVELASRLSFFLWSGIPDDELLGVAERGDLRRPAVLERQVRRMLSDPRATALVEDFASQWLQLRRVRGVIPDADFFYEFDENMRADMERETLLFIENQLREDRPLTDLLASNDTYVNERLARHYGIPEVYGERFRRVTLDNDKQRGGLLGQASILTVTAYPTRTSPVLRGKWVLDNLLGMPPPDPPADVPALPENSGGGKALSVRERMEAHRANPACATCHRVMDPIGFALEHFDAVGRWRLTTEAGTLVDAKGVLADGTAVHGPASLREALLERKEQFVSAFTQKLLAYALGRDVEYYDQPTVRKMIRGAATDNYRWSSIILGVVRSMPFQMRRSES